MGSNGQAAKQQSWSAHVGCGSFASFSTPSNNVGSYANNGQIGDPLRRSKRAKSGIQLYPQSSEGKSSHYEATNIRCVYYKEEPKPDTMERRENVRTKTPRLCTSAK
jgi:hypothetical protein